jgi:uncharacterized protein (DUF2384 family)
MGYRNRKSTHRNLKDTELAARIADVLRVVVKALDAFSERADARFVEREDSFLPAGYYSRSPSFVGKCARDQR